MSRTEFTPLHLTILISIYVGNREGYANTETAHEYERQLIEQGLIWSNDLGYPFVTEYGKAKVAELLLRMGTPNSLQYQPENP